MLPRHRPRVVTGRVLHGDAVPERPVGTRAIIRNSRVRRVGEGRRLFVATSVSLNWIGVRRRGGLVRQAEEGKQGDWEGLQRALDEIEARSSHGRLSHYPLRPRRSRG